MRSAGGREERWMAWRRWKAARVKAFRLSTSAVVIEGRRSSKRWSPTALAKSGSSRRRNCQTSSMIAFSAAPGAAGAAGAAAAWVAARTAARSMVTSAVGGLGTYYDRNRLFTTKRTLAGRSASRRMYQGNQYDP